MHSRITMAPSQPYWLVCTITTMKAASMTNNGIIVNEMDFLFLVQGIK